MNHIWLNSNNNKGLIIFFSGWGIDENPFIMIPSENYDILFVSGYQSIEPASISDFGLVDEYEEVVVVGWSMGVWLANKVLQDNPIQFSKSIAVNGTLCPINKEYGIDPFWFKTTIASFDEKVVERFYSRMCRKDDVIEVFLENKPKGDLSNLKTELEFLYNSSLGHCINCNEFFSHVLISKKDFIVPTKNQKKYWRENISKENLILFNGAHFPFYDLKKWDDLIELFS